MFTGEKDELLNQIKELQDENQQYLNLIIKHSKGEKINYQQILGRLFDKMSKNLNYYLFFLANCKRMKNLPPNRK